MDDAEQRSLWRRLGAGDLSACDELYERYGALLYRAAVALLGASHDAEDAVQDVFTNLMRSQARLGEVRDGRAYLLTALRHAAGRVGRRSKRHTSLNPHAPEPTAPPTTAHDTEHADAARAALQRLPDDQRRVITLKIDAGLTFAEVASLLDISPNTAASRYRYGLEKLRSMLDE